MRIPVHPYLRVFLVLLVIPEVRAVMVHQMGPRESEINISYEIIR